MSDVNMHWFCSAVIAILAPAIAHAGGLSGTVLDPRGLVVAGAAVSFDCGRQHSSVKTNARGRFAFAAIPDRADCSLSVTHPGFSEYHSAVGGNTADMLVRLTLAPLSQAVTVGAEADGPLSRLPLNSVSLSGDDLKRISNNTADLIRYAKTLAGVGTGPDAIYVDGLPSRNLPPAETISRITVNADQFSAEYSDGDITHIEITTRSGDRKFRYGFGAPSLGLGGRNPLGRNLQNESESANGYISGPVPFLPLTFSLHGNWGENSNQQPIIATLPQSPAFAGDEGLRSVTASSHSVSGTGNIDYFHTDKFHLHLAWYESRSGALNAGAGGLVLPEAGVSSSTRSTEVRATFSAVGHRLLDEGGFVISDKASNTRANSSAPAIAVLGDFVSGGAPTTANDVQRKEWTVKNVFRPVEGSQTWSAGVTVSGSSDANREVPNSFGSIEFPNIQAYTGALAGMGTGTLTRVFGNGVVQYRAITAAPFAQKQLIHSARLVITAGVRADYQSRYGTLVSPRVSAVTRWREFILRAGAGLFVHNIPAGVLVRVMENDGTHLQQFVVDGASLIGGWAQTLSSDSAVRSQLSPDLTRPRQLLSRISVEHPLGRLLPGAEYDWSRETHLLGSQRLPADEGWTDILESNRVSERHRIHTRLTYRFKGQTVTGHYEWIHSRDDTSGPFSFLAQQNDINAEWARSAGVSPHNVSLAGNFTLPGKVFLSLTDSWRSSAPYNITTGLDPGGLGLFTDRGGRPRNSGNGPAFNSLTMYVTKRVALPRFFFRSRERTYVNLGLQGDNLLGNKNYTSYGSIIGSPTFEQPLGASPGRSVRVWFGF